MTDMMTSIRERRSVRGPFDPGKPIPASVLEAVLDAGRWAPTAHNMQNFEVVVVDDRDVLRRIAEAPREVSEAFIRENLPHLSFSEEELRARKTGILGTMFPEFMRTPGARPDPAALREMAAAQSRLLLSSPVFLVVLYDPARRAPASEGDFLGVMSLGCVMQSMWLAASARGLGLHILSMYAAGAAAEEVKRILGVPAGLLIAFTARLGYPVSPAAGAVRVRRDLPDIAHHNRFGERFPPPAPR